MLFTPSLHPAHRLGCWLLLVISVQFLSGWALLSSLMLVPVLGVDARRRWFRLLHRSRWLMLSLLLILAWGGAGEPLWHDAWVVSPTVEGIFDGLNQVGRLSLVLASVAVLLATTTIPDLMSGTRTLLSPLRAVGVNIDPFVVRLALALHYADELPASGWRGLLVPVSAPGPLTVRLEVRPVRASDWGLLGVVAAIAAWVVLV